MTRGPFSAGGRSEKVVIKAVRAGIFGVASGIQGDGSHVVGCVGGRHSFVAGVRGVNLVMAHVRRVL